MNGTIVGKHTFMNRECDTMGSNRRPPARPGPAVLRVAHPPEPRGPPEFPGPRLSESLRLVLAPRAISGPVIYEAGDWLD